MAENNNPPAGVPPSAPSDITPVSVAEEVKRYAAYTANFSKIQASNPLISYLVVPNDREWDLSTVEQWYTLDAGEVAGGHTIYRARLR